MKNKECLVEFVQSLYGRSSRPDLKDDYPDGIYANSSNEESSICSVSKEMEVTE
jgi:hypothetical protein